MAEQSISLNPGESRVISFEAIPQEAKVYQVAVNGLTGSFIATRVAEKGFSLRLTGTWGPKWVVSFYGYPWQMTKQAQWFPEGPGVVTVKIVCLNADYTCPLEDPLCEGKEWQVTLEDGRSYILNASTGELSEDPNPPPPEAPVATPHFVSTRLPSTSPGGEFTPDIVVFLPKAGYRVYRVSLIINERALPEDNRGGAELVSVEYTLEELAECANSILGEGQYIPLDSPDNKYTITGRRGWTGTRYDFVPCRAVYYARGYVWKDLPVGNYPVQGLIWYFGFSCTKATGDVTYGPPSGVIDRGIQALLEVR